VRDARDLRSPVTAEPPLLATALMGSLTTLGRAIAAQPDDTVIYSNGEAVLLIARILQATAD